MLVVFFFRGRFQNSNFIFLNSDVVLVDKMISNDSITSQGLQSFFGCLVICSSHMMVLTICTNIIHLSHGFINYERDIGFRNKFTFILSYEEMFKI
jgi:hypothetical protein